jgi:hypothetical protein
MTPSSLDNYSRPFAQCGSIFKKLWVVAYELKQDDIGFGGGEMLIDNKKFYGKTSAVFFAFQRFIGDYLKLYQTIMMLKGTTIGTLTKLSDFITVNFKQSLLLLVEAKRLLTNGISIVL